MPLTAVAKRIFTTSLMLLAGAGLLQAQEAAPPHALPPASALPKLEADAGGQIDVPGIGAAVLINDSLAFLGAPSSDIIRGQVYVYTRSNTAPFWQYHTTLEAGDGQVGDGFGEALAMYGTLLVVGAPGAGAAYVFEYAPVEERWQQIAKLEGEDVQSGDGFGRSVGITGGDVLVGAPGFGSSGAVFVFRDLAATDNWDQVQRLDGSVSGGDFGFAVDAADSNAVVGAPSAEEADDIYFFRRSSGDWTANASFSVQPAGTRSGYSVAIEADHAVIGTRGGDVADIFRVDTSRGTVMWTHETMLSPPAPATYFGWSVAIDESRVLIGAIFANSPNGSAFVFSESGAGNWQFENELIPSDADDERVDYAGWSVSLDDGHALMGAPQFDAGTGAAFSFRSINGNWAEGGALLGDPLSYDAITGGRVECAGGSAAVFPCHNIHLQSFLPTRAMGGARGTQLNDIWGWTDPQTGSKYALVGRTDGVSIVDVSDTANPVYVGDLPTHGGTASSWRDVKVYDNYMYVVADNAGAHGLQVLDLTQLRNVTDPPVTFEETAHYGRFEEAHNLAVNTETGFAYAVGIGGPQDIPASYPNPGACGPGFHIVDLSAPANPAFAGCFRYPGTGRNGNGYTHDAQCVVYQGPDADYTGREICIGANETDIAIVDMTDKANPAGISAATYPNATYVHQGWLSDDQRYFFQGDELDEDRGVVEQTTLYVWDLQDLDAPQLSTRFKYASSAIDHNVYYKNGYVVQSNYTAGVRMVDASDASNLHEVAYFDVIPTTNATTFGGSWSNYPFFEGNVIIATSRELGLFVLEPDAAVTLDGEQTAAPPQSFALSAPAPNPFTDRTVVRLSVDRPQHVTVEVFDVLGRKIAVLLDRDLASDTYSVPFEAAGFSSGVYFIRASGETTRRIRRVVLMP